MDLSQAIHATTNILSQSPPPTLREILGAYRSKGDGDRDMLIAMLNAKSAEDQRLASAASLHRQLLEIYHSTNTHYSDPHPPRKRHRSSRSPSHSHSHSPPDSHPLDRDLPPSPSSSSASVPASTSADYSPRTRVSMTIGSLLSSARAEHPSEHPHPPPPPSDRTSKRHPQSSATPTSTPASLLSV